MSGMASDFNAVTVGRTGRQLQFAFVDVTPELARVWLGLNTEENKRDSKQRDADYASAMGANLWNVLTGECIKFGTDGKLKDGGHRLRAVILSGKTVPLLVCWGITPQAFHVIDQGWSRSRLWWEGKDVASCVQVLAKFVNGSYQASLATQARLNEIVSLHRSAIVFGCDSFASRTRGIATAQTRAIIARATYTANAETLAEFVDCLYARRVASTPNRQFVANKLIAFLTGNPVKNETISKRYRKTERALLAFIDDEPITKLYEAPGELFPLPEETEQ